MKTMIAERPKRKAAKATMKAVRIHTYGGPEVLKFEEIPRPKPGRGEVLIRVQAAGVNPVDWKIREGHLKDVFRHSLPFIPGCDVSGVIQGTGTGVVCFKKGDEIYSYPSLTHDGAYAEYMVAQESQLALKPKTLDFIQAAAVPSSALTAWQGLFELAELHPGQKVLIHGAAGGVGTFAVQLAKWKGAQVIATALSNNHEFLHSLGADQIIDYHTTRFEDVIPEVDAVLDLIGGETQQRSWKVLKKGGILVSSVSPPSAEEAARHGVREAMVLVQPNASQLATISGLIDSGKLKPIVETVLPLTEVRRAHELSQTGHTRGKIVLKVA